MKKPRSRNKSKSTKANKPNRSNLDNKLWIDFSHRLCIRDSQFDQNGANKIVSHVAHITISELELFKTQFVSNDITKLDKKTLGHCLDSIIMDVCDISAMMVAFEQLEKEKHTAFKIIWQSYGSVKKIIKNLCLNLAKDGDDSTKEYNQNICNDIDSLKIDLVNIDKQFSDLCDYVKARNNRG